MQSYHLKWLHALIGKNRKKRQLWSIKQLQSVFYCNSVKFALPQPGINVENKANVNFYLNFNSVLLMTS